MLGDIFDDIFKTPEPIVKQRTELGRYALCAHQGRLYDEHDGEIETHEILPETGEHIHTIAKEAIKTSDMDLQEAADYITEELPKIRPDLQPEALRAGKYLAAEIRRFSGNRVLICEEPVTRSLIPATNTTGEVLIVTEPDLVLATIKADTIIALDYKTGYKDRTNAEAYDDFQTCVVSWCLFAKFPEVNKIHWFYLNTRLHTRSYVLIERERDEANFQTRIFETYRIAISGCDDAWPNPDKCAQCDVNKWCKLCNGEVFDFTRNPKAYLDQFVAITARINKMENVLKKAVKDGRIIFGTEGQYDDYPKRKPSNKASFKKAKDNGKEEKENND